MKYRQKLSTIVVLLLFFTISTAPAQTTLPAEDIAKKALAATVYLEMKDNNGKNLGIGSGFFVKSNLIATNYHVIEGAAKGTAKLVGKNVTFVIEGVSGVDAKNDLALLKITVPGIKPPNEVDTERFIDTIILEAANEIMLNRRYGVKLLSLGESDAVRIGATVYVAGNPKGLEGTFSDGIISSHRDKYTKERLQMTAPISPGSSGGPVLNKKGEVIGISVAVHRALDAQNLNFAIPSKYLKKLLAQPKIAKPLSQEKQSISADTYLQWGNAKYELGDYAGAMTDYTMATRLKPDDASAYYNWGNVKMKLGYYFIAIADFGTAIRLKPDHVSAYYNRGLAMYYLKQYLAAIADSDTAIQLKPDDADAYYNRGLAKRRLGQYATAKQDFRTALRLAIKAGDTNLKTTAEEVLRDLNK